MKRTDCKIPSAPRRHDGPHSLRRVQTAHTLVFTNWRSEPFYGFSSASHAKIKRPASGRLISGGDTGTRTLDPMIKSHLLYQLSYVPKTEPESKNISILFPWFGANFDIFQIKLQEKIIKICTFLFFGGCRIRQMLGQVHSSDTVRIQPIKDMPHYVFRILCRYMTIFMKLVFIHKVGDIACQPR